jgi:hypothetical protein
MTNALRAKKPASPASRWIRLIITIALAIFIIAIVRYILVRGSQTREYNEIISDLVDQQKYEEAIPRLQKLVDTAQPSIRDAARTQLAKCYVQLGENPELPLTKSAEFYKKANDLDPSSLDETQRQAMKAGSAAPTREKSE